MGNIVPSKIKAYLDLLHCYVNWTLSVYTNCGESSEAEGIKMLSESLIMKINHWMKQDKVCDVLILMHQSSCLLFFEQMFT